MENSVKLNYEPGEIFSTENGDIKILKSLGKGKSGYSYKGEIGTRNVVLKLMHNEPVPYYSFEKNKVLQESNAYELLKSLEIPVPEMYITNPEKQYLIKDYIPGITGTEWITGDEKNESVIKQLFEISRIVESNKFNIDYFPSNFIVAEDKLYYIDYEVNIYSDEWNLINWGIYYWANREGFRRFRKDGDASAINIDVTKGLPLKEPFEDIVSEWITKYAK